MAKKQDIKQEETSSEQEVKSSNNKVAIDIIKKDDGYHCIFIEYNTETNKSRIAGSKFLADNQATAVLKAGRYFSQKIILNRQVNGDFALEEEI